MIETQGNQTWQARVPASALAELGVNPLRVICWDGCDAPLSPESIMARVAAGDTLPPADLGSEEGISDGGELINDAEHERRVAWLYAHPDSWSPLLLVQEAEDKSEPRSPTLRIEDGHHRLAAALLLQCDVDITVIYGQRDDMTGLIDRLGGHTTKPATTPIFGKGVFLAPCGTRGIRVTTSAACSWNRRCWVEDALASGSLARYGPRLWEAGEAGNGSARGINTSAADHLDGFIAACETLIERQDSGLREYLLHHLGD